MSGHKMLNPKVWHDIKWFDIKYGMIKCFDKNYVQPYKLIINWEKLAQIKFPNIAPIFSKFKVYFF